MSDYRPSTFAGYIGQSRVKSNISTAVRAARARGDALDHVLLSGPPGLGKTTLAHIIAHELSAPIRATSGPALTTAAQVTNILLALAPRECLFIDELHALAPELGEVLYPAMEDNCLYFAGRKPVPLNPWTLIGATTHAGKMPSPLRARFGIMERMEFYTPEELAGVLQGSARALGVVLAPDSASTLAEAARGTPRTANRLLRRCLDHSQVLTGDWRGQVGVGVVASTLRNLGIDAHGLDSTDRALVRLILTKYNGGPVGLQALASELGEEEDIIAEVSEPFLMRMGLVHRTPRGRYATDYARKYFGGTVPESI